MLIKMDCAVGEGSGAKCATGTFTSSTTAGTTVNVTCEDIITGETFRPKKLVIINTASKGLVNYYDEDISTTDFGYASYTTNYKTMTMATGSGHGNELAAITDTGFTYNYVGADYTTLRYMAIG